LHILPVPIFVSILIAHTESRTLVFGVNFYDFPMFAFFMGDHFLYHSFEEFFSIRLSHGLMHVHVLPTVDVIAI